MTGMGLTRFLWIAVVFDLSCKADELLSKETFDKRSATNIPPCENGGHYFEPYCYNVIINSTRWENASDYCSSAGGHLASIHSERQNDFITHLMMEKNVKNWWIGLHDPDAGRYLWEDGSDVDFSNCGTSDLPNTCLMTGSCIEMFVYAQGRIRGLWRDAGCNNSKSFICQRRSSKNPIEDPNRMSQNSSSLCEEGWYQYDQQCYKIEKNSLSWEAASARCYSLGGYLASIHSDRLNDFLADLILKNLVRHSWIGLHDRNVEGYYTWDDGSDTDYAKWRPGEPSGRSTRKQDCILMVYAKHKGVVGGWIDSPCNSVIPYICQKEIPTKKDGSAAATCVNTISHCEKEWLYDGSNCYKLVKNPMKWHDALIYCGSMNGKLISIHSQEQQDFVTFHILRQVTTDLWIGLHDIIEEGNYTWVDGARDNYLNWGRGEPSGYFSHTEDCVVVRYRPRTGYSGQWGDESCSNKRAFICQKSPTETKWNRDEWKCENQGFVSITTFFITITFVIISVALLGAIFYYKRIWLEDKRLKMKTVLFRSSNTDRERLTEIDIKGNQNVANEHIQNYNFMK